MNIQKGNYLNIFYDAEADVLYFSKGTPRASDISDEAADEIVVRKNPKTGEVTGFTILNFSKRSKGVKPSLKVPLEIDLKQVSFTQ